MIPKKNKQRRNLGTFWSSRVLPLLCSKWGRIFVAAAILLQYMVLQQQYSDWDTSTGQHGEFSLRFASRSSTRSPGEALKYKVTEGIYTYRPALINTTSPLHWEGIAPFATNVQAGQFCLPWNRGEKASDDWWTHHPDWEPFQETDAGYCFRSIPNPTKREYLTHMYRHQFQHPQQCSNLFVTRMWSSGWSADITNLIHTLQYGMLHGQVMQVTSTPWHYAAPDQANRPNQVPSTPACPLLNMYCYFLNLTSCPVQDPDSYNRDYDYLKPPRMPPRATKWLRDYIVRPQTWFRYKVYQFVQTQHRSGAIPLSAVPCTVMHVRRGDVLHHGTSSRRYHPISEYLNATVANTSSSSLSTFQIHPNILLLTDDGNAIVEAQQQYSKDYRWMFVQRPRFQADEGGWEHQLPSSDPIFEMTVLLGTFVLVQQCQSLVYSSSGFSHWILQEMQNKAEENGNSVSSIGHYNLDDAMEYERGTHNLASKSISTVFASNALKQQQQQQQQKEPHPS